MQFHNFKLKNLNDVSSVDGIDITDASDNIFCNSFQFGYFLNAVAGI